MTDNEWACMVGMMFAMGVVCVVALVILCVVLYRGIGMVTRLAGGSLRATDRERHDRDRLLGQLVEKASCRPDTVATRHAQEHIHQMHLDAGTERVAEEATQAANENGDGIPTRYPEDAAFE